MENLQMDKITDGFEEIVSQAMEEALKKKELAKATNQKVLKENDQLYCRPESHEKKNLSLISSSSLRSRRR